MQMPICTHICCGAWCQQDEQGREDVDAALGVVHGDDPDNETPTLPDEGREGDYDHVPAGTVPPT